MKYDIIREGGGYEIVRRALTSYAEFSIRSPRRNSPKFSEYDLTPSGGLQNFNE